jgi:hypothetical protein
MVAGRFRGGFLGLCALLLVAGAGCRSEKCTSSAECTDGEICAGPSNGPFQCLRTCTMDSDCAAGASCASVTNADCIECDIVTLACVQPTVKLPGR